MFSSNTTQVSNAANYIEDVFSTYLYTGNGSTQTITNGIDLAGKGGLVWTKIRSGAASHRLFDTARGVLNQLNTDNTNAQSSVANSVTSFNADGFSIGNSSVNVNTATYASWTFRKQPKFFDVVTYTGNGANRTIAHNLGSVPGCIIIKPYSAVNDWWVYHRSIGATKALSLNSTAAAFTASAFNNTSPTSTVFSVSSATDCNASGVSYVAYLFAHDAGGFGLTGTDNVISCGSYTGNGSATGPVVTLGYEPQFVMIKNTTAAGNWVMLDVMRGLPVGDGDAVLYANVTDAETSLNYVNPLSTGFQLTASATYVNTSGSNYIYIAIRRGPMKVPTSGTSVFSPNTSTSSTGTKQTTGFPIDLQLVRWRAGTNDTQAVDRLRGTSTTTAETSVQLKTNLTTAETSSAGVVRNWDNTGFETPSGLDAASGIYWNFRRAPSFFDEVCYTGTGTAGQTFNHNLGVVPEMMIVKSRTSGVQAWRVYHSFLGATQVISLNQTSATATSSTIWNDTAPTSTVFSVGTAGSTNDSAQTYVAYLFATCAGVSKVGSYTGTGTTKQVDCGFTGGARFVLIKRTDSTGGWYVWDTARGIVSGNDPYLLLNSTSGEVTSTDYVDTYSAGFEISSTAPAAINASGGTFIFLAIA